MEEKFYRFEDTMYAPSPDEWGDCSGPGVLVVNLREYDVVKRTAKGAWIQLGPGGRRFVLLDARKRFACPTIEEAKDSYRARKRVQIRIYSAKVDRAVRSIEKMEAYRR